MKTPLGSSRPILVRHVFACTSRCLYLVVEKRNLVLFCYRLPENFQRLYSDYFQSLLFAVLLSHTSP
ncbi:MAG: hypothetical protein ICV63_14225 [Coleofasciculus sp. Co-bin14]|nr:hypothetical protein [Coleofasciculus sp. Co-bin14]